MTFTPAPGLEKPTRVVADLMADDDGNHVKFDALPYLRQASTIELSDLVACGMGGDGAADDVANWTAYHGPDPDRTVLSGAFDEITAADTGFTVSIDNITGGEFLLTERPDFVLQELLDRVRGEEEITRPIEGPLLTLGQITPAMLDRHVYLVLRSDDLTGAVYRLLGLLAAELGPRRLLAELADSDAIIAAGVDGFADENALTPERAVLYYAANVPVGEALRMEADPTLRPTDDALRTLAALHGPVGA